MLNKFKILSQSKKQDIIIRFLGVPFVCLAKLMS